MATSITVKLISVHDGDTFTCQPVTRTGVVGPTAPMTVRVAGMDAPEAPFWNGKDPHGQPLWSNSKSYLEDKLRATGGVFDVEPISKSGKRDVCKVWVNGRDVARDIVFDGWAWGDSYTGANMDAMADAKKNGKGMWSKENIKQHGEPVQPRAYRDGPGQAPFQKHYSVRARNARTRAEISGTEYQIFVEGMSGPQKFIDVHKADTSVKVKITSATYLPLDFTVASEQDDSKPIEVELIDKGTAQTPVKVKFVPTNLAQGVQASVNATPPQSKTAGTGGLVFDNLTVDSNYTISYSSSKIQAGTKQITVALNMPDVVIQLKESGNGEGDKVKGLDKTEDPKPVSNAPEDFQGVPVDDSAYDNGAFQGYYTSAQCRVYIGNLFLDELNTIQYALQTNAVPLYGYCDRDPVAYAQGRGLVQGQLVLNFTADWYLLTALRNHMKLFGAQLDDPEFQQLKAQFDAAKNTPPEKRPQAMAEVMKAVKAARQTAVRRLASLVAQEKSQKSYDSNVCYWPGTFDLLIEIGDGETKSIRRIEKCKIVSNEQILDQSGQPLYDVYGFIGRRLK